MDGETTMPLYKKRLQAIRKKNSNKNFVGLEMSQIKTKLLKEGALIFPLKDVAKDFFEPESLRPILDAVIPELNRNFLPKKDVFVPKYTLLIGNKWWLKDYKGLDFPEIKKEKNKDPKDKDDLKKLQHLVHFLDDCFDNDEFENIKKNVKFAKNLHFMITCRRLVKRKEKGCSKDAKQHQDKIVAAAICYFGSGETTKKNSKTPCQLLWFGASNELFTEKDGALPQPYSERLDDQKFRRLGLGTLLLSTIQFFQKGFNNNISIICQANKTGGLHYYLQNHFQEIHRSNYQYLNYKERLQEYGNWIDSKDLVLVKSRVMVNELHAWVYENISEAEAFSDEIIPQLLKVYFPKFGQEAFHLQFGSSMDNLRDIIKCIDTNSAVENKNEIYPLEWKIILTDDNHNYVVKNKNDKIYGNDETLESLMNVNNYTDYIA
jgi:hypothetical protein